MLRRYMVFSAGLVTGVLFFGLVACAQQPDLSKAPATKALEAPRALPQVKAENLLSFMVLFSRTTHMPTVWRNDLRQPFTVFTILCKTGSGAAEILPVTEPGALTSILSNTCPCRADAWAMCAVNGLPVIHPYSNDAATCAKAPCQLGILVLKDAGATDLRVSITGPVAP